MLIRVTGPGFVAGIVLDEDETVHKAAPILKWSLGLSIHALRSELARRGFKATLVRTLRREEIEAEEG